MIRMIRNAMVYLGDTFSSSDILIEEGVISRIAPNLPAVINAEEFDMDNCFVFPGLIDVHVHLREPGFSYKETVRTGTLAAARGGFTTVCAMPNLSPVPDSVEHLRQELEIIERDGRIRVLPYGSISVGEKQTALSDIEAMSPYVVGFSDDGTGVNDAELMENAMRRARACGKIIAAHCEDRSLGGCGAMNQGMAADKLGFPGISTESEWRPIQRDIELVKKTGCRYHICHVSCAESVELVRKAKAEGLPVSCETAPHYLVFCDEDVIDDGKFRMNPPLRSQADREALIDGIRAGVVDMVATDHAPHAAEEKSGGFLSSLNGVVGLETAFPVLYTQLVLKNILTLPQLIRLMSVNPSELFGIGSPLEEGRPADLTVFDLSRSEVVEPERFLSMGRATPFEGMKIFGKCVLTLVGGETVWEDR